MARAGGRRLSRGPLRPGARGLGEWDCGSPAGASRGRVDRPRTGAASGGGRVGGGGGEAEEDVGAAGVAPLLRAAAPAPVLVRAPPARRPPRARAGSPAPARLRSGRQQGPRVHATPPRGSPQAAHGDPLTPCPLRFTHLCDGLSRAASDNGAGAVTRRHVFIFWPAAASSSSSWPFSVGGSDAVTEER